MWVVSLETQFSGRSAETCLTVIAVAGLAVSSAPGVAHYLTFLSPLGENDDIGPALAITIAPSLIAIALTFIAIYAIHC